ncbi:RraA family protein [Aureimonas fodinaquatilis]|uniref:Putative 4-hydroxy-4-methyl-2-oxoglutarate aldolase n=1 Tax=Aureimonas fodinaquatilis TaxID=2565783 RepID=A0A5B0DZS6_9HYPH|nr:RraA family protein [Aureimonas fodinaquatilis]KAA0971946.1 RraA family protein [Aureimonas fodinaquatilis]
MILHPLPNHTAIAPQTWQGLTKLQPASLGHYLTNGIIGNSVRPLVADKRMVGRAVTVRQPFPDAIAVHVVFEYLKAGDILVIDRCGDNHIACLGEMTVRAGLAIGLAGFVVDGVVTDIDELREIGIPVFAKGLNVVTTRTLDIDGAELFGPVVIGGITVRTGDILMGDNNGLLTLSPQHPQLDALVQKALADEEREVEWRLRLAKGESLGDMTGSRALFDKRIARQLASGGNPATK